MTVGPTLPPRCPLRLVLLLLPFITTASLADARDLFGLQGRLPRIVSQGEVFAVTLKPGPWIGGLQGSLDKEPLIFSPLEDGRLQALVGIDLDSVGRRVLRLEGKDRLGKLRSREYAIRVKRRRFGVQRLTLPRQMVDLDPETAARVSEEASKLETLWKTVTPERYWRGTFISPVASAAVPDGFGVRRIINDQPRSPHAGADYQAPLGSVVRASNAGRVALAEGQFFGGNALALDHGLGLYTFYFHLEEFLVSVGERVKKGQEIGRVGATGRVTGPHLHFGVRLQESRIDPAALLRLSLP